MRIPAWPVLSCVVACGFSPGAAQDASSGSGDAAHRDAGRDGSVGSDAHVDSAIDGPTGPFCFGGSGSGLVSVCLPTLPTGARALSTGFMIDTSASGSACVAGATLTPATDACVLAAGTLSVDANATVRVTGPRPLVIVVDGTVTIDGTLDASSRRGAPGASANAQQCAAPTPAGANTGGGGGGAGGSFGDAGGSGGTGNFGAGTTGDGGGPGSAQALTAVRGGCAGGPGGNGNSSMGAGGAGGPGGGVVYVIATGAVAIDASGRILANGGGGAGGGKNAGGGGGGTGGLVGFDALSVTNDGAIAANGGGGGGGGDSSTNGPSGSDGAVSPPQAPGGTGGPAGSGGAGAGGGVLAAVGADDAGGGGGGGGGAGVIFLARGTLLGTGTVSPAARGPSFAPVRAR